LRTVTVRKPDQPAEHDDGDGPGDDEDRREEGGLDGDRGVVQEAEGMLSVLSGGTSYDIRFGTVID
jgi:hypothetical protein